MEHVIEISFPVKRGSEQIKEELLKDIREALSLWYGEKELKDWVEVIYIDEDIRE